MSDKQGIPLFTKKKKSSVAIIEATIAAEKDKEAQHQAILERVVASAAPGIEAVTGLKVVTLAQHNDEAPSMTREEAIADVKRRRREDANSLSAQSDAYVEAIRADTRPGGFAPEEIAAPHRKGSPQSAFERAQNAFIDGPIAALGEAFVALYLSTRANDGAEAVAALNACRAAFDACNLELADVEVRRVAKAAVGAEGPKLTKHVAPKARVSAKRAARKTSAKSTKKGGRK